MTILGGKVHTHVRYRRGQAGFTLIELLIVVAILAILAAILIPNFLRARASSQLATCQLDLRNIAAALELFYGQNQTYPLAVSWQNDPVTGGCSSACTKSPPPPRGNSAIAQTAPRTLASSVGASKQKPTPI